MTLVSVCALLVSSSSSGRGRQAAPVVSRAAPASPRSLPPPVARPTGSAARGEPLLDPCGQARELTAPFPGPYDLTIGPLSYAGLRALSLTPAAGAPNWSDGGHYYKTGAQLPPGISATVRITGPAARYAAIITETGPPHGSHTVTYQSCGHTNIAGFSWVGGFVLSGRHAACVPIAVTTGADPVVRHVVVSLGAGPCHRDAGPVS